MMTTKSVVALAYEAGLKPFDLIEPQGTKVAEDLVADLLRDRNPYFAPEYRKRYKTRVHVIEVSHQRLALGVVESAQPPQGERRHRAVIFRCDGEVLYQTPDNRVLGLEAATVDLRYYMQHVDERQTLEALCIQQVRLSAKMREAAEKVVGILHKQGP